VRHQTKKEHAVLTQVVVHELLHLTPLAVLGLLDVLDVLLHVAATKSGNREPNDPDNERDERNNSDEHEPEPEEQEDLLAESVDRQYALDRVAVDVAKATDLDVAHRHARKPRRSPLGPVALQVGGAAEDIDAVRVERRPAEEEVEQEDLTDGVREIQQLNEGVEENEIVAVTTAATETTGARQHVLDAQRTDTTRAGVGVFVAAQISVRNKR